MNEFEKDTLYRMLVGAVRYWCVGHWRTVSSLPAKATYWFYPSGASLNIGWGDGWSTGDPKETPLRGKRIQITIEVVDG